MRANPIFKRASPGYWSTDVKTGKKRFDRDWWYRCPACGEEAAVKGEYGTWRVTRKMAKDALHRHMLEPHPAGDE